MKNNFNFSLRGGGEVRIAQDFLGQHVAKDFFHRHGMTANSPGGEKGASAMPFAVFKAGSIGIVLPSKLDAELGEGNSVGLLRITLGFLNLPNQAGLHSLPPQHNQTKKHCAHGSTVLLFYPY
jgi:hypothetical protein